MTAETEPTWPTPPPALTLRGVLIGVGIAVFAVVGAGLSVYLRRTHLEKTTVFWGKPVIEAMQIGRQVHVGRLRSRDDRPQEEGPIADLTDLPGLGHLRHAFLEDRHYEWDAGSPAAVPPAKTPEEWYFMRFSDPHGGSPAEIAIELHSGRLGPVGSQSEARLKERARKGVANYLATLYKDLARPNDPDKP